MHSILAQNLFRRVPLGDAARTSFVCSESPPEYSKQTHELNQQ